MGDHIFMPQQAPSTAFVNGQAGSSEMDSTGSARNGDEVLNEVRKFNILTPWETCLHFTFNKLETLLGNTNPVHHGSGP